jgi:hypothetical protein
MQSVASNKVEVSCDICGDKMQKQSDVYACYPCKHMIWEADLYKYPTQVSVVKEQVDAINTNV